MSPEQTPVHNHLLAALPPPEFERLRPRLERVPLKARRVLHHWNTPMEQVYFVESGLVSVTARTDPDMAVEVWLVGREGMTGIPVVLGGDDAPPHRRIVQVEGRALRISAGDLREAMGELPGLKALLLRYVQVVLLQTSQAGACNGRHSLLQRLARWLLAVQDRLDTTDLPLTHDLLGHMLGVRRAGVTEAIAVLEQTGALNRGRGVVRVADRARLEAAACGCHRVIRSEYDRLLRIAPQDGGR